MLSRCVKSKNFLFLILITLLTGLAYGICIPKLSFYGDDWIYIYNYHLAGAESFTLFTQWDRPYSAWIYVLTSAVFKESLPAYHIFVFVMRWLSVFLFWRVLINSFGENRITDAAALLFAVYPGFQQQPIAVEYVMHFTSLVLVLLSLLLMQIAYFSPRRKAIPLFVISIVSSLTAIFTCEYFVGLELTRPVFLFYSVRNHSSKNEKCDNSTKKIILCLIPFAVSTLLFFIWRIFIFSFQTYQPKLLNALRDNFPGGCQMLLKKVSDDMITVFIKAYRLIFTRPSRENIPFSVFILLLSALSVFLYFFFLRKNNEPENKTNREVFFTGIVLLLFSGIPYWGTFLDVSVDFPWDRSTLSFSPAAAMIIAVCLNMVFRSDFFIVSLSVLTALSVLFHIRNGQIYISEAGKMNDYFWQLAWRVPGLEKGTILASDEIPLNRYSDNDLSPVVNWQYAPENTGLRYDYKYFDLDLREEVYYADPQTFVPIDHTYRTHRFVSTTEKTLGIYYRENGCLQMIDQNNDDYPGLPDSLQHIAAISDTDLIITEPDNPANPPKAIGPEPDHSYCYYFQKTSLARQAHDIDKAYELASEVLDAGLLPNYSCDIAPVALAFLESKDFEKADLLLSRIQTKLNDRDYLCKYWIKMLPESQKDPVYKDFYKSHGCL